MINCITEDEAAALFTEEYPNTLNTIIENKTHSFNTSICLGFVKSTSIIRYDKRYDKYIQTTKYYSINKKTNKLYKFGLLGFSKFDPISKGEISCSMFQPDMNSFGHTLKRLSMLNSPLEIDFAVQLPIQYMQILQNSFDPDVLKISYDSSMANIIDSDLVYDDFITYDYNPKEETEEEAAEREAHTNKIDGYKVRISESNNLTMGVINKVLESKEDVDITGAFAMLPSIYTTRAVLRINLKYANDYKNHYDPIIHNMFNDMLNIANGVTADIVKSK